MLKRWSKGIFAGLLVVVGMIPMTSYAGSTNPEIEVLASIKPLQLIAQALTDGVSDSQVLLPPGVTPHDYALKPSDLKKVYAAGLLLWLGPDFEPYLEKPVRMHEGVELSVRAPNEPASHELHGDHQEHGAHDHLFGDPHIWFSPVEAERIAVELAAVLMERDPRNADMYQENLRGFKQRLNDLDQQIRSQLSTGVGRYLVAHDAYSYFEAHYGLSHVAVISNQPESKPGAKGLLTLLETIKSERVRCLFVEPQTDLRIVNILAADNAIKIYRLDPMATDIALSKKGYEAFLQDTANRFQQCQ